MKKYISTLLILMVISIAASGQVSLRPQVGINSPSISSDDLNGNLGYQFGADLQLGGTFFIQPGLNLQTGDITLKDAGDMNITRINIPVMLGFKLFQQDSKAFGVRGFFGPNLAFHVNEDLDELSGSDITGDNFKTSVFSGRVGAGLDLSILFIDLAYQFGLSDFFENSTRVEDSKTHMFIANAGIRIGF